MLKLNVGRVSLSSGTASQIVPSRSGRKELRLVGVGGSSSSDIGISQDSGVTTSTSYLPPSGQVILENMEDTVYGIYSGTPSSKVVQFLEIYDDGL